MIKQRFWLNWVYCLLVCSTWCAPLVQLGVIHLFNLVWSTCSTWLCSTCSTWLCSTWCSPLVQLVQLGCVQLVQLGCVQLGCVQLVQLGCVQLGVPHLFNLVVFNLVCSQRHFVVVIVFYIAIAINKLSKQKTLLTLVFPPKLSFKLVFVVVKGIDSLCCFVLSRARFIYLCSFGCVNN